MKIQVIDKNEIIKNNIKECNEELKCCTFNASIMIKNDLQIYNTILNYIINGIEINSLVEYHKLIDFLQEYCLDIIINDNHKIIEILN